MKLFSKINFDVIEDAFLSAIEQQKELIPALITQRLNDEGTDYKDNVLRTDIAIEQSQSFYSKFTQAIKQSNGQKYSNVTLKDSGDFYNSIEVDTEKGFININADMQKSGGHMSENFLDSYGSEKNFVKSILNLSDDDRKILKKQLAPNLIFQCKRLISDSIRKAKML